MPLEYELLWSPHPTWFPLRLAASGHHGFVKWGHDAKTQKLASFPRVTRPARARPMAHRIEGGTKDLFLSAQLEIRSGLLVGREI